MNYNVFVYFTLTLNITTPLLSPIKHPSNYTPVTTKLRLLYLNNLRYYHIIHHPFITALTITFTSH